MSLLYNILSGQLKADRMANKARAKMVKEFYEGGRITRERESASRGFHGPEDSIETLERLQMIKEARRLEEDFPLASLILDTFETYALGFVRYQPMTGDTRLNREIMEWLNDWFENCDQSGRFDFQTLARLALRGKKRDGEAGIVHVWDGQDYKIQLIGGDRIGNPTVVLLPNANDFNGIRVDDYGRVIAYDIYQRSPNTYIYTFDRTIDARHFSHVFDPFRIDQYHGVTAFKTVITRMSDFKEIMDYSRLNIKYRATQLPYYKTEDGEFPNQGINPMTTKVEAKDRDGIKLERVAGAEQQVLRVQDGVFEFPSDFPNGQFLPMAETMIREILAGLNLSYEFAWNSEKMTGTVGRLIVERTDRVMKKERDALERQFMREAVERAIQSGINQGMIRGDAPTKFRGAFFYGARISADYGRDSTADINLVKAGLLTETEYQHIHGHDPERIKSVRIAETVDMLEEATALSKKYGIPVVNAANLIKQRYQNPPISQSQSESKSSTDVQNPGEDIGTGEGAPPAAAKTEPLIASIGVGGSQAMNEVIKSYGLGELPKNAAKIMLVNVLGLSPELADEMLSDAEVSPISPQSQEQPNNEIDKESQ